MPRSPLPTVKSNQETDKDTVKSSQGPLTASLLPSSPSVSLDPDLFSVFIILCFQECYTDITDSLQ